MVCPLSRVPFGPVTKASIERLPNRQPPQQMRGEQVIQVQPATMSTRWTRAA
jgi:hypothetical protein